MSILRLLDGGRYTTLRFAVVVTCLAGLANAVLLRLVNDAAESSVLKTPITTEDTLLYLAVFAFFYVANKASLREANRYVQQQLDRLRVRIAAKIAAADLRTIETLGHGDLYATLGKEISQLEQMTPLIVNAAQSIFLLAFCLIYIAYLSPVSFVVVAGFILCGMLLFWWRRRRLNLLMRQVYQREAGLLDAVGQFTSGFQEIRLNANRSNALFAHFDASISELKESIIGVSGGWVTLIQFSNAFLYALLGTVVFVLPLFFEGYTSTIYKIAGAAIFCVGPVMVITSIAHLYAKAELGLLNVFALEDTLDRATPAATEAASPCPTDFASVAYRGICFAYRDADGVASFTSGPWDFDLRRGETVFITGGNGGGKSTVMKLLCGLYRPDAGVIEIDGGQVSAAQDGAFRELFCAIFPDFHLFEKLYGLEGVAPERVRELISQMGLFEKVSFKDNAFSTRALSSGQRKRLAMIVALLEDRPIYIFDEWAADQDAHYRDAFYHQILPDLRRRGKAVIAVTHDDRYWACCDRHLIISDGKMRAAEAVT